MSGHTCALKASFLQDRMGEAIALHNHWFGPQGFAVPGFLFWVWPDASFILFKIRIIPGPLLCTHPDPKNDLASCHLYDCFSQNS